MNFIHAPGRRGICGWRAVTGTPVGIEPINGTSSFGYQRLPTDSIGTFALTLTNLVVGSAVRIELAGSGTLIEYRVAASSPEVFTIPAYSSGNANNDLRIKVRKGSGSPLYKPYETLATASLTAQSVYIAQIPD